MTKTEIARKLNIEHEDIYQYIHSRTKKEYWRISSTELEVSFEKLIEIRNILKLNTQDLWVECIGYDGELGICWYEN